MTDYIKRTDAVKIAEKYWLANGSALGRHTGLADCIASEILSLPAADVAPVAHGAWVHSRHDNCSEQSDVVKCSRCGLEAYAMAYHVRDGNYCPRCGARMDGGNGNG
jgi:DNA-directed RNA polymerase subunit RPC12/RpoP